MALIKGIHHVALKCCSSEEYKNVAEFYGDILGLSVARKWDGGIMFDTGDGIIEVFEDGESPLPQGNIRHFAFAAEDVDACVFAVRNRMGQAARARMRAQVAKPSSPGIITSSRMQSAQRQSVSVSCVPEVRVSTVWPSRSSAVFSSVQRSRSSSTARMCAISSPYRVSV